LHVSHRPLVFVSGLTVGDYLLWSWSLNSNRDVIALLSGLTLPPLALCAFSLLVLSLARLLAAVTRRPSARRAASQSSAARAASNARPGAVAQQKPGSGEAPSRKIAA
jgi:hypothetical protein